MSVTLPAGVYFLKMFFGVKSASGVYKQFQMRVDDHRTVGEGGVFYSEKYATHINSVEVSTIVSKDSNFTVKPYIHTDTAGDTYDVQFYYVRLRNL